MNDETRNRYYQRAATWAVDEHAAMIGSLRRTRIVAGAFALIAILEALALLLLTPLKTVQMAPILVDRQTGFVERLDPSGGQELRANEALVRSLLAQYVQARESFNITDLAHEYRKVALWSGGAARQQYLALMPESNPASPLRRFPRTTIVETWIKSVSPLGPHSALVRFDTRRQDQDAAAQSSRSWAAVIDYRFSREALSVSDRWLNPLGFQVVSYHRDAEAAPPPEESAITDAPAASTPSAPPPSAVPPPSEPPLGRQPFSPSR